MKSVTKGLLVLSAATGLSLFAAPAFAGGVSGGATSAKYATLKAPTLLRVDVQVKNSTSGKIKVTTVKISVGGANCGFGQRESTYVAKGTSKTFSQTRTCEWSKIAALPGCGPRKSSCDVKVTGSVQYMTGASSAKTVQQFRARTITIQKPALNAVPIK